MFHPVRGAETTSSSLFRWGTLSASVYLGRHWRHSHDKLHFSYCAHQWNSSMLSLSLSLALGMVMSHVLEKDDKRDQLLVDNDLRVTWKLTCGAIAGATAQSGKQSHYKDSTSILVWIASPLATCPKPLGFFFLCINCITWVDVGRGIIPHTINCIMWGWCRKGDYTPHHQLYHVGWCREGDYTPHQICTPKAWEQFLSRGLVLAQLSQVLPSEQLALFPGPARSSLAVWNLFRL